MTPYTQTLFTKKSFVAAAISMVISSPLLAEENQPQAEEIDAIGVERISITARGRVETLQNVPDSVTAFSADMIENILR